MAANEGIGGDVAKFYNKLEEKGKESRQESRIYYMRNFNNWLKSMIINDFSDKVKKSKPKPERKGEAPYHKDLSDPEQSFTVLDIGCGKGKLIFKKYMYQQISKSTFSHNFQMKKLVIYLKNQYLYTLPLNASVA